MDRFTGQYEVQTFKAQRKKKMNQISKTNLREFGWFQEATQSLKRDSALQHRPERETVLCKALCPVQECIGRSVKGKTHFFNAIFFQIWILKILIFVSNNYWVNK